jgi:hypothetical protein
MMCSRVTEATQTRQGKYKNLTFAFQLGVGRRIVTYFMAFLLKMSYMIEVASNNNVSSHQCYWCFQYVTVFLPTSL